MPPSLPLNIAQTNLTEILAGMIPGEELILTQGDEPVAVLTRPQRSSWPSNPGTARDTSLWMAPDFDAPLDDFADYME